MVFTIPHHLQPNNTRNISHVVLYVHSDVFRSDLPDVFGSGLSDARRFHLSRVCRSDVHASDVFISDLPDVSRSHLSYAFRSDLSDVAQISSVRYQYTDRSDMSDIIRYDMPDIIRSDMSDIIRSEDRSDRSGVCRYHLSGVCKSDMPDICRSDTSDMIRSDLSYRYHLPDECSPSSLGRLELLTGNPCQRSSLVCLSKKGSPETPTRAVRGTWLW